MRWVYILQCEGGYFYVGETSRLYRRFWEHNSGLGGLNTSLYPPINILAIYPVHRLGKFFDYIKKVKNNDYQLNYNIYFNRCGIIENFNENDEEDYEYEYNSLWIENNITEKMMLINESNWKKVRGGKYVKFNVEYDYPTNSQVKELPSCKCGLPCDVKKENNYLYFRCPKKNIWEQMREEFGINDEPCNFFMKYTNDNSYKTEYEKRKNNIKLLTSKSPWLKEILGGHYEHCIGGCGKEYNGNNTIRYLGRAINLCFDCFINKNEELAKKYNQYKPIGECLIHLNEL
jgi:predicted GIY-YIG superfamily endonuclease